MGRGLTKLIGSEHGNPCFLEAGSARDTLFYRSFLPACWLVIKRFQRSQRCDLSVIDEFFEKSRNVIVKGSTASNNDPGAYAAIRVQSFEVVEVSIIKRIFVIPLDLKCHGAVIKPLHMVELMAGRLCFHVVNQFSNEKFPLDPIHAGERGAKSLGEWRLAPAAPDDFLNLNLEG
jgi:hypothetical protein